MNPVRSLALTLPLFLTNLAPAQDWIVDANDSVAGPTETVVLSNGDIVVLAWEAMVFGTYSTQIRVLDSAARPKAAVEANYQGFAVALRDVYQRPDDTLLIVGERGGYQLVGLFDPASMTMVWESSEQVSALNGANTICVDESGGTIVTGGRLR